MDGLTIRQSQGLLETGKTASELKTQPFDNKPASLTSGEKSFADTLKEAVQSVNTLQKQADVKAQELATGKTDNIQDVMMASEKADIALRLMVNVRNKIIDAYQEVMKMQV
ncbi:MAG: flagellar hook-basal body complex protein FliE [Bdellovibrionaceae bacterium]|nr:flagellar hook-basal body complex protein FliE [Pseudobdellovibrionaceae bacterium]